MEPQESSCLPMVHQCARNDFQRPAILHCWPVGGELRGYFFLGFQGSTEVFGSPEMSPDIFSSKPYEP
jgi:hypothetical protein